MNIFDHFRPYPERKSGIVNLSSGTSFRGIVWQVSGGWLVLRNVEMLQDRDHTERRLVDGEVIVKLVDVDFVQVIS